MTTTTDTKNSREARFCKGLLARLGSSGPHDWRWARMLVSRFGVDAIRDHETLADSARAAGDVRPKRTIFWRLMKDLHGAWKRGRAIGALASAA